MAAAHEVFAEEGMDAASVERVCERAGFTRGAFYSNFATKEELFFALIQQLTEEKLDEVAGRVRGLEPHALADISAVVRHVVDASIGERMDPQLVSEMRTQALRDPRLAEAYLAWQGVLRDRVAEIIGYVTETNALTLRLSVEETAELLLDVSDDTCMRATIEGLGATEITGALHQRIEKLIGVLVEFPST